MDEENKMRPKKGLIAGVLAAVSFVIIPYIIVVWIESGPILGYSFSFALNFKVALGIFGILFIICMFFYGYFPSDSRRGLTAAFFGSLVAAIFYFNFVCFGLTDNGSTLVFTSETTLMFMTQPTFLFIVIFLLTFVCFFGFFRILKLIPTEEDIERYLRKRRELSRGGVVAGVVAIIVVVGLIILIINLI